MDVVDALPRSDVPTAASATKFAVAPATAEGTVPAGDPGRFSRELASFVEFVAPEVLVPSAVAVIEAPAGPLPTPITSTPQIPPPKIADAGLPLTGELETVPSPEDSATESLQPPLTFFLDGFIAENQTGSIPPGPQIPTDVPADGFSEGQERDDALPSLYAALATAFTAPISDTPSQPDNGKASTASTAAAAKTDLPAAPVSSPPAELIRFLSGPAPAPVKAAIEEPKPKTSEKPVEAEPEHPEESAAAIAPPSVVAVPTPVVPIAATATPTAAVSPPEQPKLPERTVAVSATPKPSVSELTPRPTVSETVDAAETAFSGESKNAVATTGLEGVTNVRDEAGALREGSSRIDASANSAPTSVEGVDASRSAGETNSSRQGLDALSPVGERLTARATETQLPAISARDPQQFAERLGQYVLRSQEQGQQLSVRITPPDLGTIVIEVRSSVQGLNVRFETSSPAAQQLLVDQMPQLREALVQLGRPADRVDVIRTDAGFGAGVGTNTGGSSQQTFSERREPVVPRPPEAPPRSVDREVSTSGTASPGRMQELNIRV